MSNFNEYIKGYYQGVKSLLIGMRTSMKVFCQKKVTEQYPENRATLKVADRFRGELKLVYENGEHKCVACGICQMNCPNGTIQVIANKVTTEDGKTKRVLDKYMYDLGSCTFCQLCVVTCPHDALEFDNAFEHAVFTREKLVKQLNHDTDKSVENK